MAAIAIISLRPIKRDTNAGNREPKNAPPFREATMLEDMSAALPGFVENLKAVEKLIEV
jgi:hypothetical protein